MPTILMILFSIAHLHSSCFRCQVDPTDSSEGHGQVKTAPYCGR